MGTDSSSQVRNQIDRAGDGSAETDTVIGSEHIIVHGFGDRNDGKALTMDAGAITQGVVSANGDEHIDTQFGQSLQYLACGVDIAVLISGISLRCLYWIKL